MREREIFLLRIKPSGNGNLVRKWDIITKRKKNCRCSRRKEWEDYAVGKEERIYERESLQKSRYWKKSKNIIHIFLREMHRKHILMKRRCRIREL